MKATLLTVRGGITTATLREMQRMIDLWSHHAFFVQLAREIADAAGARTREEEARAIWDWTRKTMTYRADPWDTQWIQDPYETAVRSRSGNCANQAILVGTMLQALGHRAEATAVRWEGRDTYSHAVVQDHAIGAVVDSVCPSFDWPPRPVSALLGAL